VGDKPTVALKNRIRRIFHSFRSQSYSAEIFILAEKEDTALLAQGKDDDDGEDEKFNE